ncbi:hypothetical protein P3X46_026805 [Hevea brasiliensis]|uniref:K Homology domain-containing protein n=1 Tax=Hevea brasiliensis TaxID=3981 RepID=A0ABQ9KY37_HEVBR|nr:branchpoint-bridging protein [Hevea brasiliensis]KAJ9153357.1 hypothetical protein P3X46_026805 [Hevea brasiliensis]
MSTEVDQTSAVETHKTKMSSTNSSSGASTTGLKVSIFAAKSGFVIPKNKLSGSLVPIFRGGKKSGGNDAANEDSNNQGLRKTKWGPDPNQDAAVRKGRALAYQTRVDQITQQLELGILESGETQDSQADQHADLKLSSPPIDIKDLKLERREIIGEILKLNPSYKAPPDYEPLLKEATVPIPVKDHPGYNFVGLIFGPGGETHKRLEKETGAKIQAFVTKANTGKKVEISPSDTNDTHLAYEELNVHVSADTFEKVDEAVALIELLVTSVSGNLATGKNVNVPNESQEVSSPFIVRNGEHGVMQLAFGAAQTPQQGQFQNQGLCLPAVSAQATIHPPGFIPSQNSSAPINNNLMPVHSSPLAPTPVPSLFGPRPIPASGFNSNFQNTSPVPSRPQLPMQVLSHPYPPRNFPMPAPQPSSAHSNVLASLSFTGNQAPPALLSPVARPLMPSLPRPVSSVTLGPQSDRSLTPVGSSSGWPLASGAIPASLGPGNMGQMVPPMGSLQGPRPVVPQPGFLPSAPPSTMPAANIVSPVSFPSAPSAVNVLMNQASGASSFPSVPPPQVGSSSAPVPHALITPMSGSMPISLPMTSASRPTLQSETAGSFSGNVSNPTLTRPTVTAPKLLHSGPGDFTFQPHHPQNPAPHSVLRPSNQPMTQDPPLARPLMQPSPQTPSFRLAAPNSIPPPGMHVFPSSHISNQMGQTQPHMSPIPFVGNSTGSSVPPRVPAFSNASPTIPPARNFSPVARLPDLSGPFPPRPGNPLQVRQSYPGPITPQGNFMASNQQSNRNLSFASSPGGQQIYDPFSPTSVPIMPQQQGGNLLKGRKQEADPEYEDLMASVGVK